VLEFTLFKIRGRNEMTFDGIEKKKLKKVCKVVEYFLAADLVR